MIQLLVYYGAIISVVAVLIVPAFLHDYCERKKKKKMIKAYFKGERYKTYSYMNNPDFLKKYFYSEYCYDKKTLKIFYTATLKERIRFIADIYQWGMECIKKTGAMDKKQFKELLRNLIDEIDIKDDSTGKNIDILQELKKKDIVIGQLILSKTKLL